jgi:hypothetical protein
MYLPLILFTLVFISIPDPISGHYSLPKRLSMQQVLTFLKQLNIMMKESQSSYRLHKRGRMNSLGEEEDPEGQDDGLTNLTSQWSRFFPQLNGFLPSYYVYVGRLDQVGK